MGFRFRKRIKILPGVNLNISKSGISTSLGKPGATVNIGKKGVRTTVGLPGSGLSWSSYQKTGDDSSQAGTDTGAGSWSPLIKIGALLLIIYLVAQCF